MAASPGRESGRAMIARCWRTKPSEPTASAIARTSSRSGSSARREGATSFCQIRVVTLSKAPFSASAIICSRGALVSGVAGLALVSSKASRVTRCGACPHHLEGGIAPHRQSAEGEALRRDGQQPFHQARKPLVAVMLRDQHRAPRRESGPLRRVETRIATQPRDQDERFGHGESGSSER